MEEDPVAKEVENRWNKNTNQKKTHNNTYQHQSVTDFDQMVADWNFFGKIYVFNHPNISKNKKTRRNGLDAAPIKNLWSFNQKLWDSNKLFK